MEITEQPQVKPRILFVDDATFILKALHRLGKSKSWDVYTTLSAEEALDTVDITTIDVVISDMQMPGMSGDKFLTKVREISPNTTRILLTGHSDVESIVSAINNAKIYNYLTKPWDDQQLEKIIDGAIEHNKELRNQSKRSVEIEKQNKKLSQLALLLDRKVKEKTIEIDQALSLLEGTSKKSEQNFYESLGILAQVIGWKEGQSSGYSQFVTEYCEKIGQYMDMDEGSMRELKLSAMLHRIGLLSLPDELRTRPIFSFDPDERKLYQRYPVWGEMALSSANSLQAVAKIVRHHQESVNGNGFPDALIAPDIPLASKIIRVTSDFYDVYNGRLERNISGFEQAENYISQWIGTKYDTEITKIFQQVLVDFEKRDERKITINSSDLKENMRLETDIMSDNGTLLLSKGTKLNLSTIKHLQEYERKYEETMNISIISETDQ